MQQDDVTDDSYMCIEFILVGTYYIVIGDSFVLVFRNLSLYVDNFMAISNNHRSLIVN
jgi:hypothetical protein